MERIETVIVGGGQAGMATSSWLRQAGHDHVVLERSDRPAHVWSDNRWDSFSTVTPNLYLRLPGAEYDGSDPNGFLSRAEIVGYFEQYAARFEVPLRYNTTVTAVEPADEGGYVVRTTGRTIRAANVVIATGFFQIPRRPAAARALRPDIMQLHTTRYRNPESLPDGAVLVVGSAMSGCQIAEELYQQGRTVFLSTGTTGRLPRRYRGRDIVDWLDRMGFFEIPLEKVPKGSTKFDSIPHLSGVNGGHTINLHRFARDGVTLLGRLGEMRDTTASFLPNLHDNLTRSDAFETEVLGMVDEYIGHQHPDTPQDDLPRMTEGFDQPVIESIDLAREGISTVIWATGYAIDYSIVRLPVVDPDGFPIQDRGVTRYPGLYFTGIPWMPSESSGTLGGVGASTRHIAARIAPATELAHTGLASH